MARGKKRKQPVAVADMQPDELNALKALLKEFMNKLTVIEDERNLLAEDAKELVEEYSDRLDMKTLKAAVRVVKIQQGVEHRDTFDTFLAVLEDPTP